MMVMECGEDGGGPTNRHTAMNDATLRWQGRNTADLRWAAPVDLAKAVRIPKVSELIAADIRKQIICGIIPEGEFLPSQIQLVKHYGTSRSTIREAFRILESEQLISLVHAAGRGARVHGPNAEAVARLAGFALQLRGAHLSDLYQARLAVEPFAVRLVAAARRPKDIARLRAHLDGLIALVDAPSPSNVFRAAVAQFHSLLVELTGNPVLALLAAVLEGVVETHKTKPVRPVEPESGLGAAEGPGQKLAELKALKRLVDHMEAGDADGAELRLRRHLENGYLGWSADHDKTALVDVIGHHA